MFLFMNLLRINSNSIQKYNLLRYYNHKSISSNPPQNTNKILLQLLYAMQNQNHHTKNHPLTHLFPVQNVTGPHPQTHWKPKGARPP